MAGPAFAVFVAFTFVFGLMAQALTITIFVRDENRHFKLSPYFVNLVVCNLLLLLSSYPLAFIASVKDAWVGGEIACQASGYIVSVAAAVSFVTMAFFTMEIYRHVTKTDITINERIQTKRCGKTAKIISFIWVYSCVCVAPPLLGWSSMTEQSGHTNCAPDWVTQDAEGLSYLIFLVIAVFLIPMAVTAMFFIKLYRYFHNPQIDVNATPSFLLKIERYKMTLKVVFAAILANALCWSPYALYSLVSSFKGEEMVTGYQSLIPAHFAKISAVVNPIVYWIFNPRKSTFIRAFRHSNAKNILSSAFSFDH
uniref:Opsin n=1 Tax=Nematostella vectensis TaxID=45351 RepID=A9UMY6_NEMVE|nr:TPA: opsin [Nematostella vectensis]